MALGSKSSPREILLVHLSQAVSTLSLRKEPNTCAFPLKIALRSRVQVQSFEVSDREFGHFEKISTALTRIDKGTYGRCLDCGKRIEPELLAKTPWASECLACGGE